MTVKHFVDFRPSLLTRITSFLLLSLCTLPAGANADQVLAIVGDAKITDTQLESALASAPFATQFPSMDEEQQAAVRGNMLVRLVDAEIFRQEARAQKIDQLPEFHREVVTFRTGLLYQRYMQKLRDEIEIPPAQDDALKERYRGNADGLAAARSAYISKQYKQLKKAHFVELAQRYGLRVYPQRLDGAGDDTLLAEADGFTIRFGDIRIPPHSPNAAQDTRDIQEQRLDDFIQTLLAARAAEDAGIDVSQDVADYEHHLLPRILIERKEREWIPDSTTLRDYYQKHPEIGHVPESRHIAQIVLPSHEQAEAIRKRIMGGESFFRLAGEYSIDPVGRQNAGDLGWVKKGSGFPAVEEAIANLKDNEVSEIVESPRGFHLVMIMDRTPARQRPLSQMEDRVRQAIIAEHVPEYLETLSAKYPVQWVLPTQDGQPAT